MGALRMRPRSGGEALARRPRFRDAPTPLLLLAMSLLTGCSIIPGIQVDADGRSASGQEYEIRPIDGQLVEEISRGAEARLQPEREDAAGAEDYDYRVGPGDVLSVVVWNHPELTNPFGEGAAAQQSGRLVHQDGTLFFPYVGPVEAAGKTTQQIQDQLVEGLRPYVQQPQVNVRVQEFRSKQVYVTGKVREPGPLPITDQPLTVLDALSGVGGFNEGGESGGFGANARRAILTRDGETVAIDLRTLYQNGRGNRVLQDGDILHVPDASDNKVFVLGQVQQQSTVPLHNGELTLAEALAGADGIDLNTADTERIYVIRGVPANDEDGETTRLEPRIYRLDARDATALLLADSFPMQPRDVVYVPAPGIVRWNRVLEQIMPSVQAGYRLRVIEEGFDD